MNIHTIYVGRIDSVSNTDTYSNNTCGYVESHLVSMSVSCRVWYVYVFVYELHI